MGLRDSGGDIGIVGSVGWDGGIIGGMVGFWGSVGWDDGIIGSVKWDEGL